MRKNKALKSLGRIRLWGIIIIISFISSCNVNVEKPLAPCAYLFPDSSASHPKKVLFQNIIDKYRKKGLPGISLCVYDSNGLWVGASGCSVIENGAVLEICNLHHSASVAKMYIASGILKLAEMGKINLDFPAITYLPSDLPGPIDNLNKATVRQLLNHSSGIYDFNSNPKLYTDAINDPYSIKSWRDHLEKYTKGKDAYFAPGTGVHYSNTGYLLLGLMIETASGESLGAFIKNQILVKNNLLETYYKQDLNYPLIKGVTNSYFEHFEGEVQNCTSIQSHFANISMGHEGIIASPRDYMFFLNKLLNEEIISKNQLNEMFQFIPTDDSKIRYGLGMMEYTTDHGIVYGHSGGGFGTMTYLLHISAKKTTLFVGANLGSIFKTSLTDQFYKDLFDEIVEAASI